MGAHPRVPHTHSEVWSPEERLAAEPAADGGVGLHSDGPHFGHRHVCADVVHLGLPAPSASVVSPLPIPVVPIIFGDMARPAAAAATTAAAPFPRPRGTPRSTSSTARLFFVVAPVASVVALIGLVCASVGVFIVIVVVVLVASLIVRGPGALPLSTPPCSRPGSAATHSTSNLTTASNVANTVGHHAAHFADTCNRLVWEEDAVLPRVRS